jgi:hypothetical protein
LHRTSIDRGWPRRCKTIQEAYDTMLASGKSVQSLVVPADSCGVSAEEATKIMGTQGYVTLTGGVQVLVGDLKPKTAIITASDVGYCVRTAGYFGILLQSVDSTVILVEQ